MATNRGISTMDSFGHWRNPCSYVLFHRYLVVDNLVATFFDFVDILPCASWGILGILKKQYPRLHSDLSNDL